MKKPAILSTFQLPWKLYIKVEYLAMIRERNPGQFLDPHNEANFANQPFSCLAAQGWGLLRKNISMCVYPRDVSLS